MKKIRLKSSVAISHVLIRQILIGAAVCSIIGGCSPYAQFYKDLTGGKDITQDPNRFIISSAEPKLIQGVNIDADSKRMLENSYSLIGYSSFNGADLSQQGALGQAKRVHAETVIVYSRYTHTLQGVMPIETPDNRTYSSYDSGTIHGSGGGYANYSGSSYGTSYGTKTTYVPYAIARYDYYASFWVKIRPLLGIYFDDLTDELRQKLASNKGIYVTIVIKNSPAFNSDLLVGDVIRRANGIEVTDKNQFHNWLNETHPSVVGFEIFRNGETITKKVQLPPSDAAIGVVSEKALEKNVETIPDSNSYVKQTQAKPTATTTKSLTVIQCENCGHEIGKLEKAYVHEGHIVCSQCFLKLKQKP